MDQLNHLPRKPLVAIPKLLLRFLILLEIIDYGLSAVLFHLGLYPSFATQPSPWDLHSYRGFFPPTSPSPPPVSSLVIKKQLRTVAYSRFHSSGEEEEEEEESTCSVCLCRLEERDVVRELGNCRHAFHKQCIDAWVDMGKITCPLCRLQLLSAEEMEEGITCMTNHQKEEEQPLNIMLHGHEYNEGL
ncbi:E3 ubiquitin-protein ligase RHA1B-like [Iris pallida]|uniref:E3 ubiquitin-protein ligase RHA1B-like n=1 Tax=Iris pallida TaxID=29817 RepID=A0AAX6F4T1_IRIPA|nr:E3 ubiquitin-protein ligase RHA1B-like [Iris pallida]